MPRKTQKKTHGQVRLLLSGVVALAIVAMALSAVLIAEEEPGSSITLTLDQQTVLQSAPTLGDPYTVPDEGLQRAARQSLAKNSGWWGAWQ